jgi:hypothetical protein
MAGAVLVVVLLRILILEMRYKPLRCIISEIITDVIYKLPKQILWRNLL